MSGANLGLMETSADFDFLRAKGNSHEEDGKQQKKAKSFGILGQVIPVVVQGWWLKASIVA